MQSRKPEIHYLNAVVVLAEKLNYTSAASRLGMTQSGLSRCIQAVEHSLGVRLFERSRGRVELTDPGRAYVEEARISILHSERAVQFAKAANAGVESVLLIGNSPDVDPRLVEILFSIRLPLYPTLKINVHSEFSSELAHSLLTSHLDVALITHPERNPKLTTVKLTETPLYLVVPEDHILARKEVLKLQDLGDSHWVLFDKRIHPSLYESVMLIARDGGFRPKEVHHILHADEAEHLLAANGGVAFLTRSQALRIATRGLVAKPLDEDSLRLDEHLAARADNPSKLVSEFVRFCEADEGCASTSSTEPADWFRSFASGILEEVYAVRESIRNRSTSYNLSGAKKVSGLP
jgi:DNA-binding transcriptional LysR family regulator